MANNNQTTRRTRTTKTAAPSVTSSRQSFKDFYTSGKSLKVLADGCYDASIIAHKFVEPETKTGTPYVRLDLQLPDRQIPDNRFPRGFDIFIGQIKKQLGIEHEEMSVPDLLNSLLGKPIKVWISNPIVEGADGPKQVRNIDYLPPIVSEVAATAAADSKDVDF